MGDTGIKRDDAGETREKEAEPVSRKTPQHVKLTFGDFTFYSASDLLM